MIVWDANDSWAPCVKHCKCLVCRGRLSFPFVYWQARTQNKNGNIVDDGGRFICGECCDDMCRGFSFDMRQIKNAKEVERLGFDRAGKQAAVSGGFLYTTGTTNKQ
jgi:hypothetical protein